MSPVYRFKAKDDKGVIIKDDVTANNLKEANRRLKSKGLYPILIESKTNNSARFFKIVMTRPAGAKELAVFSRQLAVMIKSGLTLTASLLILTEQLGSSKIRKSLEQAIRMLEEGNSLQVSLGSYEGVFPSIYLNMIGAGEKAGALETVLERMAIHYEKEYEMQKKMQGALLYPSILLISSLVVLFILSSYVLPEFAAVFFGLGVEIPFTTNAILIISELLGRGVQVGLFAVIVLFTLSRLEQKNQVGINVFIKFFDRVKLNLPGVNSIYKKIIMARFSRTFSTLIGNGIPMLISLELVKKTINNSVIEATIQEAYVNTQNGAPLSKSFSNQKHIPLLVEKMIAVGEETGSLEEMLIRLAEYFELESRYALEKLSSSIEPIMIIFMTVVTGIIVISFVLPMMQIWQVF